MELDDPCELALSKVTQLTHVVAKNLLLQLEYYTLNEFDNNLPSRRDFTLVVDRSPEC